MPFYLFIYSFFWWGGHLYNSTVFNFKSIKFSVTETVETIFFKETFFLNNYIGRLFTYFQNKKQ